MLLSLLVKSSRTVITCQIIHYLLDSRTAVKIVFKFKKKKLEEESMLLNLLLQ